MGKAITEMVEEFVTEYKEQGTFAENELIREVVGGVADLVIKHPDYTPEEYISILLKDIANEVKGVKESTLTPGMVVKVTAGNLEGIVCDGYTATDSGILVNENTLFDQASVTKEFTSLIAYNLINEGLFNFDTKIKDLDSRFVNMEDLTIEEILGFTVSFRTPGRVDDVLNSSDAYDRFINMTFDSESRGNYNYNDMGMMMLKEVMETVTGKSYDDLAKKYIFDKGNIVDIYTSLPDERIKEFTGSANQNLGLVNDPKNVIITGKKTAGHAGCIASVNAMQKYSESVRAGVVAPDNKIKNSTKAGVKANRGVDGHTYVAHPKGIDMTSADVTVLNGYKETAGITQGNNGFYCIQGSTRVDHGNNISSNSIGSFGYSILANPCSTKFEDVVAFGNNINEKRVKDGANPFVFAKKYTVDGKEYSLIDGTRVIPLAKYDNPIVQTSRTALKLSFLSMYLKDVKASAKIQQDTKCLVKF